MTHWWPACRQVATTVSPARSSRTSTPRNTARRAPPGQSSAGPPTIVYAICAPPGPA